MLHVGDTVPDFTLPLSKADGTREPVPFRALLANGPVVLSFFPIAFSGVCTPHVCELRDHVATLAELRGASVVAFSTDAPQVNVAFARAQSLPFGIYSDPNREVLDTIWASTTTGVVQRTAVRGWMVVDAQGKVRATWAAEDPEVWSGVKPIEQALSGL